MSRPAEIEDLLGIVEGGLAGSKVEAESTDPMDCSFSASLPVATIALRAFGECTQPNFLGSVAVSGAAAMVEPTLGSPHESHAEDCGAKGGR
jgi:hypothetical protein